MGLFSDVDENAGSREGSGAIGAPTLLEDSPTAFPVGLSAVRATARMTR